MRLIKPRTGRIERVRHICRLQRPNRDALMAYARFIGDTPDYGLNALIGATLAKDREILDWQAGQGPADGDATPTSAQAPSSTGASSTRR